MKVLHINKLQSGGAALCAIRINNALVEKGIESRILFGEGNSMPEGVKGAIALPDVVFWNKNIFLRAIKKFFKLFGIWLVDVEKSYYQLQKANESQLFVHQPLSSYKNITSHPLVEWADIIHLHWVSDFIDYPTFFQAIKKPIVWTLHDKYPAVGVMHYCSAFHPIPVKLQHFDAYCRKIKRESISQTKNLHIVAISEMMTDICRHSDVIGSFPVTMIHNGVDTTLFRSYNKNEARQLIGLKADCVIFLFCSLYMHDTNKGLERAIVALEKVDIPNKALICIGQKPENTSLSCAFPIIFTGIIQNDSHLAMHYSAADYFLLCSYEETFAQTPLEAMACGTPVISTPCSGAKDIIRPFNGVVCKDFDADAIAEGIREAWGRQYKSHEIRQFVEDHFSYDIIAQQYIDLYKSII